MISWKKVVVSLRARFQNGIAKVSVPEDFRIVTDPEGLTVQVTPVGAIATIGVIRMSLDEIVVMSSRNVEFSYLVQGVRRAFREIKSASRLGWDKKWEKRKTPVAQPASD
jgi:hypothetical protein